MNKGNNILYITKINTPLKEMLLGATDKGLCLLVFVDGKSVDTMINKTAKQLGCSIDMSYKHTRQTEQIAQQTEQQLEEYFAGKRTEFSIPLVFAGTPFQKQVWQTLCKIPYGQTWSYKQEAQALGKPTAYRAVANANGSNPICIIVPCHRVIGSTKIENNINIGGYSAGLWRKQFLLALEEKAAYYQKALSNPKTF